MMTLDEMINRIQLAKMFLVQLDEVLTPAINDSLINADMRSVIGPPVAESIQELVSLLIALKEDMNLFEQKTKEYRRLRGEGP